MDARRESSAERNHWVRPVALLVLGMMMAWNSTGWGIDKGPTFEGVFLVVFTLGLMALGINASAQLRRCFASVETPALRAAKRFWGVVLISTSLWSAGSAHHAYGQLVASDVVWSLNVDSVLAALNAAPLLIVLTAAAFFEPLLMWAIETVEHAARKSGAIRVSPLETQAGTSAATPVRGDVGEPPKSSRPAPAAQRGAGSPVVRKHVPSLPLTDDELQRAVDSLVARRGAEVVSLANVAREAQSLLGRPVPKKRVEQHPKRREIFERAKAA